MIEATLLFLACLPFVVGQTLSCTIAAPTTASVQAGTALSVTVAATGTAVARVDLFLAASSSSVGCKQLEVPSSAAGQTAFTGNVNIPIQATGTFYVYAKCKPLSGSMVVSAYMPVAVTGGAGGNIPPTISLTSPSPTGVYTAPTTLAAAAVACDLDGTLQKVTFYQNGVNYATATAVPYVGSLAISSASTITFTAAAVDNTGATTLSNPLTVTVTGGSSGGGGGGGGSTWTLTVKGGIGTGTYPQYTWVNVTADAPPARQVFAGWTVTCSGQCPSLQFTDKASSQMQVYARSPGSATLTSTYKVDTGIPTPVTSHPRLLITLAQVPMLQSWAVPSNPMYANGFKPALTYALGHANAGWSWSFMGGTGAPLPGKWSDTGGDSWEGDQTEAYAMFLAFSSIIHNDITHAQRAKDLFMWVIRTAAVNGPVGTASASGPFGSPFFATFNRASHYGDGFGATYDWLQWWPNMFTATEKVLIRQVFLMWANAAVQGYMHPAPVGVVQDPTMLLPGARGMANNYASAHMRQLAYYALSFDAADDPPVDLTLPEAYLGNTLRSYIPNVSGAWLYQKFAIMEVPATVAAAYGIPATSPNLGSLSGGLSPEGFLYGSSMVYVMQTLAALHTCGWGTVGASGLQMALINSTWWDKYLTGFLTSIVPAPFTATGSNAYMGQVWQMHNYGDCLRLYIDPTQFDTFGMLGWWDKGVGSSRAAVSQWIGANVVLGGPAQLYQRAANIWGNSYARGGILHFLLYDPTYGPTPDPRPALPLTFTDPSLGRVVARTGWTNTTTSFAYKCSWEAINHQLADCGQFELWRKGEWVTKENTGYATDSSENIGASSTLHNTLSIQNTVTDPTLSAPPYLQPDDAMLFSLGSQQAEGYANAGDPNTTMADTPTYTAVFSSFATLYNIPQPWTPGYAAVDVLQASRSLVWLKGEEALITYDRATTAHSGKFKRWNMNFIAPPTVSGNVVTAVGKVNKVAVTTLLPANRNITVQPIPAWKNPAEYEPSSHLMTVEDPTKPADVRFLHVLQVADAAAPTPAPAVLLAGSVNGGMLGTAHGALVGNAVIMFRADASPAAPPVASMSFSVPAGAPTPSKILATGLVPGAPYTLNNPGGQGGTYLVTQGGAQLADTSGVVLF